MAAGRVGTLLQELYQRLWETWGPQNWWPGDTAFEMAVGAILTQNTNWRNVSRAITALKDQDLLEPQALHDLPETELARLIRPAGYYNVKARRLKNFLDFLGNHYGHSMERLAADDLESFAAGAPEHQGGGAGDRRQHSALRPG